VISLQLDLVTNFDTACSSVSLPRQLKTRWAMVLAVRSLSSPTQTHYTPTSQNRKEGGRNNPTNQDILSYPPSSVHVEWNWKECAWPPLTFQTV